MVRELAEMHGTIGQRRMGGGAHPFLWAVLRHSAKVPSHSRAGRAPWGIPMAPVQACPARQLSRPVEASPAEIFRITLWSCGDPRLGPQARHHRRGHPSRHRARSGRSPDRAANLLEVVAVKRVGWVPLVIHAIRMRMGYEPYLRGQEDDVG